MIVNTIVYIYNFLDIVSNLKSYIQNFMTVLILGVKIGNVLRFLDINSFCLDDVSFKINSVQQERVCFTQQAALRKVQGPLTTY